MGFTPKKKDDETKVYPPLTDPEFRRAGLSPFTIEERRKWEVMFARFHKPHETLPVAEVVVPASTVITVIQEGPHPETECYWEKVGADVWYRPGAVYCQYELNLLDTGLDHDPVIKFGLGDPNVVKFTMGVDDSLNDAFVIGVGDGLGAGVIFCSDATRNNTLVGLNAGYSRETTTPYLTASVAVGENALYNATGDSPWGNVAVGYRAGEANSSGCTNIYIGYECGSKGTNNMAGDSNVFIGTRIGDDSLTTALDNVAIGYHACNALTTGGYNSIIGMQSALILTTGGKNTALGYQALDRLATGSSNVALGYQAGWFETSSNHLWIDNTDRASLADGKTKALIYGVFAAATADQSLYLNSEVYVAESIDVVDVIKVDGVQVVSNRVIDARCADAIASGDATTDGVIDALRDAMIAHGLIAAS